MAFMQIDPTTPAGSEKIKFGDDRVREFKQQTIDNFKEVSNYPAATKPALRTAVWTTAARPAGAELVDRVSGYNTDLKAIEYYDLTTTSWKINGVSSDLTVPVNEAKGTDIASAATTNVGGATGNYVTITGTTTITAFGAAQAGAKRVLRFADALVLTHNATSLILPGAANIATVAGDVAEFVSEGGGNWRCLAYQRAGNVHALKNGECTQTFSVADATSVTQALALGQFIASFGGNGCLKIPCKETGGTIRTLILQWCVGNNQNNEGAQTISWPTPFTVTCCPPMVCTKYISGTIINADAWYQLLDWNKTNVTVYRQAAQGGTVEYHAPIIWAIGY